MPSKKKDKDQGARVRPLRSLSEEHQKRVADSDSLRAANPNKRGPAALKPKKESVDVS